MFYLIFPLIFYLLKYIYNYNYNYTNTNYNINDNNNLHLAVICDGNRRYGLKVYKNSKLGHYYGAQQIYKFVRFCKELNIGILTLFLFSNENFNRSENELNNLFKIAYEFFYKFENFCITENIKANLITTTNYEKIPAKYKKVFELLDKLQDNTKNNTGLIINLLCGYSGRDDINQAVIKDQKNIDFKLNLKTNNLKDPDILIRTSGEKRLSNFMLYQIAYTELFFLDKYWPELNKNDIINVLNNFYKRKRRFGK